MIYNHYKFNTPYNVYMFKDKDGKEIYKKLFDKLEKERLT